MILGVDHVQVGIPVGAEDAAREFYCEFLGLKEIEKPAPLKVRGGLWLQLAHLQVHLGVEDGVDRNQSKAHVAYEVPDLGIWRSKLQSKNISVLESTPISGANRIEFRDPFGNRIEFIHWL